MNFFVNHFLDAEPIFGGFDETIGPMSWEQAKYLKESIKRIHTNFGEYKSAGNTSIVDCLTIRSRLISLEDYLIHSKSPSLIEEMGALIRRESPEKFNQFCKSFEERGAKNVLYWFSGRVIS